MKFKKKKYNIKQYGKRGKGEWDQFFKKLCIALIKQNFRPKQNNYEVYMQIIKDVRKNYYLQLNKPSVKLRIGWNKTNKIISIKIINPI